MPELRNSFPVVVFTGGPTISAEVLSFLSRLELDSGIDLLAVISESPVRGASGIVIDLWQRRGILTVPILIRNFLVGSIKYIFDPAASLRRRTMKTLKTRVHYCDDIHATDVLQMVRGLSPELGLIYGGPIVKPELFSIPARGTLGIHHGKVPEYRGKKTTFWAVYNGEDEVAVIIQKISDKLDAGDIVLRANVQVRNRPLPLVRNELRRTGVDLYLKAITAVVNGRAKYIPQAAGSNPLYKDPTVGDILRFWGKYLVRLFRRDNANQ
jgi:folate-dependent phosphoribosylglycinamide formyltransferase PurN